MWGDIMHYRFENQCTIKDFICSEDIRNNGIYVVDPGNQMIRYARSPDEYITERLVFVYNICDQYFYDGNLENPYRAPPENHKIPKGTRCRCWIVCMQMV